MLSLRLITDETEKAAAQHMLDSTIQKLFAAQGMHLIGFPGGSRKDSLYSNGNAQLWVATCNAPYRKIPCHLNLFGTFDAQAKIQTISVECNIPFGSNSRKVSGCFAKDINSSKIYLLHSGKIGGGRKSVGRSAFLSWLENQGEKASYVDVENSKALIVCCLQSSELISQISAFVQLVEEFKLAVRTAPLAG